MESMTESNNPQTELQTPPQSKLDFKVASVEQNPKDLAELFNTFALDFTLNHPVSKETQKKIADIELSDTQKKAVDLVIQSGITPDQLAQELLANPPEIYISPPNSPDTTPIAIKPTIEIIPPSQEDIDTADLVIQTPQGLNEAQQYFLQSTIIAAQDYLKAPKIRDQWGREHHSDRREPWEEGVRNVLRLLDNAATEQNLESTKDTSFEDTFWQKLRNNRYTGNRSSSIITSANGITSFFKGDPQFEWLDERTQSFENIVENAFDRNDPDYDNKTNITSAACRKYLEDLHTTFTPSLHNQV